MTLQIQHEIYSHNGFNRLWLDEDGNGKQLCHL